VIGTKLGSYEITAKLGEGGMGVVYKAKDFHLGREVALKLLPEAFVRDPERLARFEREAKVLASLNHPKIAQVYGLEIQEETRALVMELVEGPTLAERLESGPLPLDECLSIAGQIAEALEEAHEKGIVHRDLKPANVKVDPDDRVKVLDFGLAKAMSGDGGITSASALANSPTLTQGATAQGVILGTAAYMAPEQAKGKTVDKRADIWAFGVVLFEMLVGRRLFEAETLAETLGAIFRQEIDFDDLPATTPPRLRRLVERCLERDPRRRLRDIGEARIALEAIADGQGEPLPGGVRESDRRGLSRSFVVALVAGAAAVSGLLVWSATRSPVPDATVVPQVTEFSLDVEQLGGMTLSPDGRRLVWLSGKRGAPDRALWVRDFDNRTPRRLVRDPDLNLSLWSPDGTALAVSIGEKLWRYPVAGGEATPICDFPRLADVPAAFAISGAWLRDDTILFGVWRGGIYRVPSRGGMPEIYIPIDPAVDVDFHAILELPADGGLLLAAHRQGGDDPGSEVPGPRVELFRAGRRTPLDLGEELTDVWSFGFAQGVLLARRSEVEDASVWGVPLDLKSGAVTGKAFVVLPHVESVSVAADGTLAWVSPRAVPGIVVQVDNTGCTLATLGKEQTGISYPELSPDGSRLAMVLGGGELWVEDLRRDTVTRLVREDGSIYAPQWSPDGRVLYYTAEGKDRRLMRIRADPGATSEKVLDDVYMASIAPGARGILFNKGDFRLEKEQGLFWAPLESGGRPGPPRHLVDGIGTFGRLSPDGRLLAYGRIEGRRQNALLTTFPALDQTIQLSSNDAGTPRWSADGRAVYYTSGGKVVRVEVALDRSGRLTASPERKLFDYAQEGLSPDGWSVAADDSLLLVKPLAPDERSEIVVARQGLQRALAARR